MHIKLFLFFVFLSYSFSLNAAEEDISEWRTKSMDLSNSSMSYISIPLGLSDYDFEKLSKIEITHSSTYDRFGSLEIIQDELPRFIEEEVGIIDPEIKSIITSSILSISSKIVQSLDLDTAWVTIRFTKPNRLFEIPRWHTDGAFYEPYEATNFKYAAVLKGPGTLFANELNEDQMKKISDRIRDNNLISQNQIFSPQFGDGVLFKTGGSKNSAVHSEPHMNEDRIFFSIVPGTYENINELKNRWNK
ncbi:MAG: hypothetical protein AB8G05_25940 [Oligoflexales bacterium]